MKYKLLHFSLLSVLVIFFGGLAFAQNAGGNSSITEELTLSTFGISGTSYTSASDVSATSSAVYAAQMAGGNNAIQLRSSNSNSGIVTTKSGGTVKYIKVEWNSNTADARTLDVYGKGDAYSAPTDLYNSEKQGTKIASFVKSDGTKEITIDGSYEFIGFRSNNNAMYIDKITIVWESNTTDNRVTTTISFAEGYATSGVAGETIYLPTATVKAGDATVEGATITWTSSDETVATINEGKINLLKTGTTTIKASFAGDDNNKPSSASYTLTVTAAPYTSFTALQTDATATSTPVTIQFNGQQVVYVNGVNAFLADSEGNGLLIYTSNHGLEEGQVLNGTINCNLTIYQGNTEITNFSKATLDITTATVTPVEKEIADITKSNQSTLVTLKNVTFDGTTNKLISGNDSITFYDKFKTNVTLADGIKYNVTGIIIIFNGIIEIAPRTADDIVATEEIEVRNITSITEFEDICYSGKSIICDYTFSDLLVTYQGANHTYVTDGNRAMMMFGSSNLKTGQRISGTIRGTASLYLGTPEFIIKQEDINVSVLSSNNDVAHTTITAAQLKENTKQYMSQYVSLENVRFETAYTTDEYFRYLEFKSDGIVFRLFNLFNRRWEINTNATYTLDGMVGFNKDTIEIAPMVVGDLKLIAIDEPSGFRNFNIELNKLLTNEDGETVSFGLSVAENGTVSRVAADAANAAAVVTGKTGNDHGLQNFSATVKVEGAVKITMGTCSWGGDVTVKNAAGETVATFTTKKGEGGSGCYKGNGKNDENIVSAKYVGEATTLTISGGAYVNFFAVEKVEATSVEVSYSIDDIECEGNVLPTGGTYAAGDEYTIPAKNHTLYMEGYTLTGWSDGTNVYAAGEKITLPNENLILAPIFTKNEVSLADRTEPVTVKFDFQKNNGAPSVQWQNQDNLIWVTQAEVNGKMIDVPTHFSTTPGKFNNTNWGDWCQINEGTTFTIPSCKGAVVSVEAYNELSQLTIDGQNDYTSGKTISYTVANSAEKVNVVFGNEGSYYRYIQVVLPVIQQEGPKTFENEAAAIVWNFNDASNYATVSSVSPEGTFSTTAFDLGGATVSGTGTSNNLSDVTFVKIKPASGASDQIAWTVKPAAGLTFTPVKVSGKINRGATDVDNGITISVKAGNGEPITLGNYTALRYNRNLDGSNGVEKDKKAGNKNIANSFEIELTTEQQNTLSTTDEFTLFSTIGVGTGKEGFFSDIHIEGLLNGTIADVAKYTLTTVASPEASGNINIYPVSEQYEEGSEVTLTATENFGYDFVNWTNAAGEEVSTEAKFKYTVNANETLTANFQAVETYELALTIDGTNEYMVTVDPAPTMVDGKSMYEAGTAVQLTANQYEGLVTFTNWSDGETNSSKLISMIENITLTAVYTQADIIAGWDFYKSGGNGRKADFFAQDNDADALSLVNTESGETQGWLDKSTEAAGGYESFKGAAVNWRTGSGNGDVGNWHWQTKVNAEAFTDINVQFQMLYNYNAYQTYNVEFSTDGTAWTKAGSITMTGTKSPASFNGKLPEATNNQKELSIRMIADKTSNVEGSASANDGNTLAMFFITGTPKLVDDPVAPALVSCVPANNTTGASATGKIVLNFDKKVQIAEGTKATLGTMELTPAVSGKVITFEYKGLDYSTEYTFTLPANSVKNLTGATLADAINIKFTTMERPAVRKGNFDAVVGNVDELMAAITAAQARSDKNVRYRIFIKNGEYVIPVKENNLVSKAEGYQVPECITFINTQNLSLIGESRDGVIITNGIDKNETFAGTYGTTSKYDGIGNSDVFQLSGSDYYFQDLTIESGMDDATGRDLAVQDKATRTIYKNTGLRGFQDTWTSNNDNGLYYFEGGYLRGRTDYMCGKGDAFFNSVELRQIAGGYAAVPSKSIKYGYVYKDCVINGEAAVVNYATQETRTAAQADGNYTLGRPWGSGTPIALFIDTKMNVVPSAIGWNEMSNGWPKRFAEFNSTTKTGSVIDLSGRKKTFGEGHENNPVLTAEEALEAGNMHNMFGEWDPSLATEQAPSPKNVKVEGTTLSWDDSQYAFCWAVVKNDNVIAFTTEPTYTIDDATAIWSVRAANEMGGLGEAIAAEKVTGINVVEQAPVLNKNIYNLQGIRVEKATKGLFIINGKKVVR